MPQSAFDHREARQDPLSVGRDRPELSAVGSLMPENSSACKLPSHSPPHIYTCTCTCTSSPPPFPCPTRPASSVGSSHRFFGLPPVSDQSYVLALLDQLGEMKRAVDEMRYDNIRLHELLGDSSTKTAGSAMTRYAAALCSVSMPPPSSEPCSMPFRTLDSLRDDEIPPLRPSMVTSTGRIPQGAMLSPPPQQRQAQPSHPLDQEQDSLLLPQVASPRGSPAIRRNSSMVSVNSCKTHVSIAESSPTLSPFLAMGDFDISPYTAAQLLSETSNSTQGSPGSSSPASLCQRIARGESSSTRSVTGFKRRVTSTSSLVDHALL